MIVSGGLGPTVAPLLSRPAPHRTQQKRPADEMDMTLMMQLEVHHLSDVTLFSPN